MAEEREEVFLEGDNPIPGQSYCLVSFLSPEEVVKDKQLYMFNRFMTQRCGEWEEAVKKCMDKSKGEDLKGKMERDILEKLRLEMKYTYEQFKSRFEDFQYKFHDQLEKDFNEVCDYKTNIRGVKVRGVYETLKEAEIKAKSLQKSDRSFHVFIGSVGQWLPWDPCADRVQNEEYLESELNNLMKEYKKNEINKDIFYEEQKKEKKDAALKERLEHERKQKEQEAKNKENMATIEDALDAEDPWLSRRGGAAGAETSEEVAPVESTEQDASAEEEGGESTTGSSTHYTNAV